MKDDEFDELIRQKLESGSGLPASPADVSRVIKYVSKKKGFPVKGGISHWWYFIVPVAAVVTYFSVVKNHPESNPIQEQKHEIIVTADSEADTNSNPKPEIPEAVDLTPSSGKNVVSAGTNTNQENLERPVSENKNITPNATVNNSKDTEIPVIQGATSDIPNKLNINGSENTGNDNNSGIIEPGPEKSDDLIPQKDVNQQINADNKVIPSNDPILSIADTDHNQIKLPDSGQENNESIKHRTQKKLKVKPFSNNGIFKRTNEGEFKAGPSFAVFQHSYGFGLDAYRSVIKNTGIHAGFHYSIFQPEHFTNREDFDIHHQHGKPPPFDEHLHGNEKPVDIIISNKALQFNVGITHYFRLKNNFSIPLTLGTNLDVKLWQNLNFRIENDTISNKRQSFITPEKATAFNNIYLTTGLEKSWRSWSIQVQPFLGYQFNTPGYRRFKWEPGIGAGVFYIFGK